MPDKPDLLAVPTAGVKRPQVKMEQQ